MTEPDNHMDTDEDYDYEVENNNAIVSMDTEYSSQELGSVSKKSRPSTGQSSHAKAGSSQPSKDKASEKEVIDVDKEPAKDQGRREIASRSEMWKHFTKVKNAANVLTHGRCNYCHRPIKADTKLDGTSALKRHFNICKRNPHLNRDPTQPLLQRTPGEAPVNFKFDPDALKKAFAQMIIEDELPFAFGEKSGFRKFMAIACPRFNVPSRRTTTRDAVRCYFEEKAKLKKFVKDSCQRVCLTTDCWTSQQQDGYMTVTTSFVDENWILHKKVINFFLVKGHKGEDIGKKLLKCMAEWGMERVLTITVDNASANDGGILYVRKQLNKTPGNIAKGKFMHMRCAADILNLIVQDGLKEVDLSIQRVRAAVRYIRNGGNRIVKFKEILEEEKVESKAFLKNDVPTRWNSTYIMLRAANVYEKVFTRLAEEDLSYKLYLSEENDGLGCPDETDWENAKKMEEFLGQFFDLTTRVSASLSVTSNTFFHEIAEVHLLIQSWLESEDSLQVSMGQRMKDKFDKYWGLWHINNKESMTEIDNVVIEAQIEKGNGKKGKKGKGKEKEEKEKENINLLIFIAAVVDPRYKLSAYTKVVIEEIFGPEKGQLVWAATVTCLNDLFEDYRQMYAPTEGTAEVDDTRASKVVRGSKLQDVIAKRLKKNNELIEEFGGLHIAKGKGKAGNTKGAKSVEVESMCISKPGPSS
ncbi:hypothetical protein ACQ4PT_053952 [Festuca glaucescens]